MTPFVKEIIKGVAIGVATAIILQLVNALGGLITLQWIWDKIFMGLWPMWVGLLAACLYWFIKLIVKIQKKLAVIERLERQETLRKVQADLRATPGIIRPPTGL